jgi:hypothetical protein
LEATPVNGDTNQRLTTAATETLLDYKEEARRLIGEHAAKVVAALGHWDRREPDRLRWALGKAACNILSSERSTLTLATSRNPLVYLIAYVRFEFRHVDHFGKDARLFRKARRIDSDETLRDEGWNKVRTPFERAELKESGAMARKYARMLPWRQRAVIALYYYRGLGDVEIGRRLNTSRDAVRQLRRMALMRLRSQLKEAV